MAEYPWGTMPPVKRVAALERQIRENDGRRTKQLAEHRTAIAAIDEADRGLKADLRTAQSVVEREFRESQAVAASRTLEKVLGATGVDIGEALSSGLFERLMREALGRVGGGDLVEAAGKAVPSGSAAGAAKPRRSKGAAEADPQGDAGVPEGGDA